jgi:hypothetical protein
MTISVSFMLYITYIAPFTCAPNHLLLPHLKTITRSFFVLFHVGI